MTKHEAAVFTAFTGVAFLSGEDFGIFHQYAEKLLGRSLYTHELGMLSDEIREKARPDFMRICREATDDSWIDSKDRLPEIGEDVLIYVEKWGKWGKRVACLYRSRMKNVDLMWQTSDGGYDFTLSDVTKWMPLPD